MNLLQNFDAVLGIIVSTATILGFFSLMMKKGRKTPHSAPDCQPASGAPQQRPRSRFPVAFVLFVAISGLAAFGWMSTKRGDRDGFSHWGNGGSSFTSRTWNQSWRRSHR